MCVAFSSMIKCVLTDPDLSLLILLGLDIMFEDQDAQLNSKDDQGKDDNLPFIPKEEEFDVEEFEKLVEDRYKQGSRYVRYADDDSETKRMIEKDFSMPSAKDPTLWKVKCTVL